MPDAFLILDPALLIPPRDQSDIDEYRSFWVAVVAWAADSRVRVGRWGHQLILEELGQSWPDSSPPRCPNELARLASQALNQLLTRVATAPQESDGGNVERFEPAYVRDADMGTALGLDVAEQHQGLSGAATRDRHWASSENPVAVIPGPPLSLHLVMEPGTALETDVDIRVREAISRRRLTIVGGLRNVAIQEALERDFETEVRWIEAETDSGPNVDPLKGMQPDGDVVFCLLGGLGHAGCQKARKIAQSRGVMAVSVENAGAVAGWLREQYGRPREAH